jgi:ferric-dicitrate binding protein FerR (iron transport regulator)
MDVELLARYFSGEVTTGEIKTIEAWISLSDANRKEFDQLKQTWDLIGTTHPGREINIEKEWKYLQRKIGRAERKSKYYFPLRRIVQVAAAILILLCAGWFLRHMYLYRSSHTQLAEIREIILSDGSKVTLNAGSRLQYPINYGVKNRQVILKGEAYFEVKKDTLLPFVISMNEIEIKVLGTSFNVKAYKNSDKIEVTVTDGKISMYDKNLQQKKVIATKGEKAEYDRDLKIVRKSVNVNQNYMAWKTLKMVFANDKLSTVAETIGQVYHKEVVIKNVKLNNCTLTTRFEGKDLETVLKVLESTLDLTIEQENDIVYISGKGCE